MEVTGELHAPAALLPTKEPAVSTGYWIGGRVSQRAGLIAVGREKSLPVPGIEFRRHDLLARNVVTILSDPYV
jgi:hypothetical protein